MLDINGHEPRDGTSGFTLIFKQQNVWSNTEPGFGIRCQKSCQTADLQGLLPFAFDSFLDFDTFETELYPYFCLKPKSYFKCNLDPDPNTTTLAHL